MAEPSDDTADKLNWPAVPAPSGDASSPWTADDGHLLLQGVADPLWDGEDGWWLSRCEACESHLAYELELERVTDHGVPEGAAALEGMNGIVGAPAGMPATIAWIDGGYASVHTRLGVWRATVAGEPTGAAPVADQHPPAGPPSAVWASSRHVVWARPPADPAEAMFVASATPGEFSPIDTASDSDTADWMLRVADGDVLATSPRSTRYGRRTPRGAVLPRRHGPAGRGVYGEILLFYASPTAAPALAGLGALYDAELAAAFPALRHVDVVRLLGGDALVESNGAGGASPSPVRLVLGRAQSAEGHARCVVALADLQTGVVAPLHERVSTDRTPCDVAVALADGWVALEPGQASGAPIALVRRDRGGVERSRLPVALQDAAWMGTVGDPWLRIHHGRRVALRLTLWPDPQRMKDWASAVPGTIPCPHHGTSAQPCTSAGTGERGTAVDARTLLQWFSIAPLADEAEVP